MVMFLLNVRPRRRILNAEILANRYLLCTGTAR